jgi:hypothetical protein
MDFCEKNSIDFIFSLSGNGRLDRASRSRLTTFAHAAR